MKRVFLILVALIVVFSVFYFINKSPMVPGKYKIEWAANAQEAKKVTREEVLNMIKPVIKRQPLKYDVLDLAPDAKDPNISILTLSTVSFIQDRLRIGDSLKEIARNLASFTGTNTKVILTQPDASGKPKTISEVLYNLKENTTSVKFF